MSWHDHQHCLMHLVAGHSTRCQLLLLLLHPCREGHVKRQWSLDCSSLEPVTPEISKCAAVQADVLMDKRIVVVIDSWEPDSMYPAGHYVRTLGVIGERATETEVRLLGQQACASR